MKLRTTARVLVTLEIARSDTWDETCTQQQIWKQAAKECLDQLGIDLQRTNFRVIGAPTVTTVMTTEERG